MKLVLAIGLGALSFAAFAAKDIVGGSGYGYENSLDGTKVAGGYGDYTTTSAKPTAAQAKTQQFAQCKKLTSLDLSAVTEIGDAAFAYSAMTTLTIPANVTKVGFISFGGCTNLTSVTVKSWNWATGTTDLLKKEPFRDCTRLTTLTVPGGVPSVDVKAIFQNLKTIYCPSANLAAWKAKCAGVSVFADISYTVKLDVNSGVGGVSSVSVKYTQPLPRLSSTPTRSGYTFSGYWTAKSGGIQYYGADGIGVRPWDKTAAVTLYAQWTPVKCVVTLVKYNGTSDSTFNVQFARNYNFDIHTWIPVRSGYIFDGWWTAKYGTGEQIYGADGIALLNTSCWSASKNWRKTTNTTLYAKWQPKKFTVTLVKYNNTPDSTFQVEYSKNTNSDKHTWIPIRCGYTFNGWWTAKYGTGEQVYTAGGMAIPNTKCWNASCGWRVAGNMTLYANWIPKTFTITLVPQNGGVNSSVSVQYSRNTNSNISAKNPTRSGYVFAGWFSKDGVLVYDENGIAAADSKYWNASRGWRNSGSLTVYAHWVPALRMVSSYKLATVASSNTDRDYLSGILPDGTGTYYLMLDDANAEESLGFIWLDTINGSYSGECIINRTEELVWVIFEGETIILF